MKATSGFLNVKLSGGPTESTVNELVSKRFVKQQQMRWTKAGAHQLLQVRVQVLDEELHRTFERWYPGMQTVDEQTPLAV